MESRLIESPFRAGEERVLVATAIEAMAWAWAKYEHRCCVLSSMQDATVIELAMRVDRRFPIVFLDTGYHFDETWETLRRVERFYGIDVRVVGPLRAARAAAAPGECCEDKPELLDEALRDADAWISGIRRTETAVRSKAELIETDRRGLTKINPLAQWSDSDADRFMAANGLIRNPLLERGFTSIGCRPCTSRPADLDDPRSGRWAGTERVECGLHL